MTDDNELPPLLGREQTVPRRRWRWLLPLFVAMAAVSLAGVVVTALVSDDAGSPERVIDDYLTAVEKGDTVKAYGLLCQRFRKARPYEEFRSILVLEKQEAGGVTDHQVARVEKVDGDTRVASYTVRRADGDVIVDAGLTREGGKWRVCGFKTRGRVPTTTTSAAANQS